MDGIKINKSMCLPYKDDLVALYPEIFQMLDERPPSILLVAMKHIDYDKIEQCKVFVPKGIDIVRNI